MGIYTGATVIIGTDKVHERDISLFAEDLLDIDRIQVLIQPGIDAALAGVTGLGCNDMELFAQREIIHTRAMKSHRDGFRECVLIADAGCYRDSACYCECIERAARERRQVVGWRLFSAVHLVCLTEDPQFMLIT